MIRPKNAPLIIIHVKWSERVSISIFVRPRVEITQKFDPKIYKLLGTFKLPILLLKNATRLQSLGAQSICFVARRPEKKSQNHGALINNCLELCSCQSISNRRFSKANQFLSHLTTLERSRHIESLVSSWKVIDNFSA